MGEPSRLRGSRSPPLTGASVGIVLDRRYSIETGRSRQTANFAEVI